MHLDKTSLHGGIGYFMTGDFVQMVQRIRRVGLRSVALPIIGAVSVLLVACGATDEDVVVPTTAVIEPDTPVAVAPEPTERRSRLKTRDRWRQSGQSATNCHAASANSDRGRCRTFQSCAPENPLGLEYRFKRANWKSFFPRTKLRR